MGFGDNRNISLRHTEYIQDVVSSATSLAFKVQTININPGLSASFPWASGIAQNYMYYRIHNLKVIYKPTCATSIANGTNVSYGTVYLRAVHDVVQAVDGTAFQMENSYDTISDVAYRELELDCEKKTRTIMERSVRIGAQPANTDLRFYDDMFIEIASSGVVATSQSIGKLYFEYDISLIRPVLQGGQVGNNILTAKYQITAPSSSNSLGTAQVSKFDNIGIVFTTPATCNAFSFPANIQTGTYLINYCVNGSSQVNSSGPVVTATSGCTILQVYYNDTVTYNSIPSTSTLETATRVGMMAIVQIIAPSAVITFTPENVPTAGTCDFLVTQINGQVVS